MSNFSGFYRKLAHQNPTNHIQREQHNMNRWHKHHLIFSPLLFTLPHNVCQFPFLPPILSLPLIYYAAPFVPLGHVRQPLIADKGQSHDDASPTMMILSVYPPYLNFTINPTKPVSRVVQKQVHRPHAISLFLSQ